MRALGKSDLPATITCDLGPCRHVVTIKHDFWAATAFYESATGERVVLKIGRTVEFAGMPMEWIGRWLCRREMHFYKRLADLPNVPKLLGTVGRTGFVHAFVPGQPLSKERPVPDGFFDRLLEVFERLHERKIAYVDTNKPQNILQGDDGQPHLIDFQISFDLNMWYGTPLSKWIFRKLVAEDRYHVLKHKKRFRPDELTPAQDEGATRTSWIIRTHRLVSKPYFLFRRRIFKRLRTTGQLLPEGSK